MSAMQTLADLSRTHCVGVCSFLVPAMLLLTLLSLALVYRHQRAWPLDLSVGCAGVAITLMIAHVGTWFAIGVVTPITFILISLSALCLLVNASLWLGFSRSGPMPFGDYLGQFNAAIHQGDRP